MRNTILLSNVKNVIINVNSNLISDKNAVDAMIIADKADKADMDIMVKTNIFTF